MIVVTHEMEFAVKVGNRLLLIDAGQIVHDGPPSQRLRGFWQHVA